MWVISEHHSIQLCMTNSSFAFICKCVNVFNQKTNQIQVISYVTYSLFIFSYFMGYGIRNLLYYYIGCCFFRCNMQC